MTEVFNINNDLYYGIIDLELFANKKGLSGKREIETKGKEYLLTQLLKGNCEVVYDDKGKPFVKDQSVHISVSHSHHKLAIIVNRLESTGIDIELIRDKVLKIKHKFLNETELSEAGTDIEKMLVYWAAKETLYKIYGLKEVDFIAHLFIDSFNYNKQGSLNGHIRLDHFKKAFALRYEKTGDYILVYALHEIKN